MPCARFTPAVDKKTMAVDESDELPLTARLFAVCLNFRKLKHIDLYVVCVCVGLFVCAVGLGGQAPCCLARRRNHAASNLRTRALNHGVEHGWSITACKGHQCYHVYFKECRRVSCYPWPYCATHTCPCCNTSTSGNGEGELRLRRLARLLPLVSPSNKAVYRLFDAALGSSASFLFLLQAAALET